MKWVGGTLHRVTAASKDSDSRKQKAHFARQRAVYGQTSQSSSRALPSAASYRGPLHSKQDRHAVASAPVSPIAKANAPSILAGEGQGNAFEIRKRRLLSRHDWLQLSLNQPVQQHKRNATSGSPIGRRRAVEKSNRKAVTKRLDAAPIFQERKRFHPTSDSHPGQHSDIRVRIGTDAFNSQTQQSRPSLSPIHKTSMRAPSTAVQIWDEASELFKEQAKDGTVQSRHHTWPSIGDLLNSTVYSPSVAVSVHEDLCHFNTPAAIAGTIEEHERFVDEHFKHHDELLTSLSIEGADPLGDGLELHAGLDTVNKLDRLPMDRSVYSSEATYHTAPDQVSDIIRQNDQADWSKSTSIYPQGSSHVSMQALPSSSSHHTSPRSHPSDVLQEGVCNALPVLSTPRGAGTQASLIQHDMSESSSIPCISDGMATNKPPSVYISKEIADDQNALWREFVLGGEDDDEDEVRDHHIDHACPPSTLPSMSVSGLGTSDVATAGYNP